MVGALLPPATKRLIRQIVIRSVKDILILAVAGLLSERIADVIGEPSDSKSIEN